MSGPINIPNTAGVVTVNTSNAAKTLLLPLTASIYGKIITIKDISSNAANCNVTIRTRYPPDLFEDGTSNYLLKNNFGSVTFLAKSNIWYTLNNSVGGSTNPNVNIDLNNLTIASNFYVGTSAKFYTHITYAGGNDNTRRLLSGQASDSISYSNSCNHTINGIAYNLNSDITVALTDNSNIWTSSDSINFTFNRTFDNGLLFDSLGFGYIGTQPNRFPVFLVANSSNIYASFNGSTWISADQVPDSNGNGIITSINYNSNVDSFLFTISGGSNNFYYIDSNSTGTNPPINTFSYGANKAFWNGSLWVAVGSNSNGENIAYSTNGTNWSYASNVTNATNTFFETSVTGVYGQGTGIYYANDIWVAVGRGGFDNYNIYVSSDGLNYTQNRTIQNSYNDIVYNISGNIWCAAADGNINMFIDVFTNSGESLASSSSYDLGYITTKLFTTVQSSNYPQVHITSNTITANNITANNTLTANNITAANNIVASNELRANIIRVNTIYSDNYLDGDGNPITSSEGNPLINSGGRSNPGVSSLSSIVAYGLSSVYGGFGISSLSSIVAYGLSSINGGQGISSLSSIVAYGLSSVNGGDGISSLSSIVAYGLSTVYGGEGISSLSSIVAYGLSTVSLQPAPGVSSLSSIVAYGLSTVYGGEGISSLSSIVAYGLSSVYGGEGVSSLSSIVAYGLSTVYGGEGISSLSSIVAYGLSTVYGGEGISSLSSIVAYGLSTVSLQPAPGVSSLSSIVAYGLSSVYGGDGISSLSSIVAYGLSSVNGGRGISSLSSIVAYGLSSVYGGDGISSLSSIVAYGLSSVHGGDGISSLSSIVAYGLSTINGGFGISSLSSIVTYGLSSIQSGLSNISSLKITTSSLHSHYISSGIADFSTISTQTILVGYVGSPLQVNIGVETPIIYASNIESYRGYFTGNVGIGRKAPYWYALDVIGNSRFENIESIANITSSNIQACNISATYFYGDATNMTNIPSYGVSTLSSIVAYGLSTVSLQPAPGVSSLSSIVAYGLSSVNGGRGISSLSSIVSYGLSTFSTNIGTFLFTQNASVLSNLTFGSNDGAVANTVSNLVIFKGPSAQNQVYVQTTGSFSVETGVTAGTLWNSNPTYGTPSLTVDSNRIINLNTQTSVKSNALFYDSALNLHTTFCNQVGSAGLYMNQNGVRGSNPVQTIQDGIGSSGLEAATLGAIHIQQNSNAISPGVTGITFGGLGNTNPMAGILSVSSSNSGADLHLMTSSTSGGLKDRLTITSNGFVGVNTPIPSVTLEVSGDTTIHGSVNAGTNNPVLIISEAVGIQYYTNGQLYNTNFPSVEEVTDIQYNGTIAIACTNNGKVYYSYDIINWKQSPFPLPAGTNALQKIGYGNGIWNIVGNNTIEDVPDNIYSYDGIKWISGNWPLLKGGLALAYNPNISKWITGWRFSSGSTTQGIFTINYPYVSPIVSSYIVSGGYIPADNARINYIYYNQNCNNYIALLVNNNNNPKNVIQYSFDGLNFSNSSNNSSRDSNFFPNSASLSPGALSVDYGNGQLIVVGADSNNSRNLSRSNMYYSVDGGISFTVLQNNISNITLGDIKYFSDSTWFATARDSPTLYRSDNNGSNWISIPLSNRPTRITVANVNPFTTRMSGNTSINKQPTVYALDINGSTNIGSNYGLIVGVAGTIEGEGTVPIILYENNLPVSPRIFNYSITTLTSIATNGFIWIASGNSNKLLYSYDGHSYYDGVSFNDPETLDIYLSYGSNIWLAVASNSTTDTKKVSYSFDGISWTLNNSNFNNYDFTGAPRYNSSYWLIPANGNGNRSNSLLYTTNPLGGSNSYLPATTGGFTAQANAVEWNESLWVATGITSTGSNVQYSYDGRNWSNTNISFSSSGTTVAYGNNIWVVGGNNGIFRSVDGISFIRSLTSTNPGIKDIKFIQNGPTGVFYGLSNTALIVSSNGVNWFNVTTFSGLTTSRLALGYNGESLLSANGNTTTNFLTVNGTTTTNALTVNGATNLGPNTNATNLNITGSLTYSNQPVLLSVNNITNTTTLNVSGSTTTNTLNVTGLATFSNTTMSNLNITRNLTYNNRQPHYFTYVKQYTSSGWDIPANGLYSNMIFNNTIPGVTTTSNYIFGEWLLTIVGYNILPHSGIATNISAVYAGQFSNNWGYYIRGPANLGLSNITLNFIAYPANFIFNSGTTSVPINQLFP